MSEPLLDVEDLVVAFHTDEGVVRAVEGSSFQIARGATLALVGESGCGKSVTSLAIMGLLPEPAGRVERGQIRFEGRDLLTLSGRDRRRLRGSRIAMIFQEPMSSLNPVHRVGRQVAEGLRLHRGLSRAAARARVIELFEQVGIPAPEERIDAYPHELSGGMRQRVMIAMALACEPSLLIADEPTTALDVTIQAQILELLLRLAKEREASMLFITHDLGVVAQVADEVAVMYAGKIVERGPTAGIFAEPAHPYTRGLLESIPQRVSREAGRRLPVIPGVVPDLRDLPKGCRFQDRCADVEAACREAEPPYEPLASGRLVACFVAARRAA